MNARATMSRWSRARWALVLGTLAVGVLSAGEAAPEFSHAYHINEEGAVCDSCHQEGPGARAPGLNREACSDCHGEVPVYQLAAEARRLRAVFDHRLHAREMTCDECHESIVEDEIDATQPVLSQGDCMGCHAREEVKLSERRCTSCHQPDPSRVRPASHAVAWQSRHGSEALWGQAFVSHGRDCELCHQERSACDRCHRERRPRDHTALWSTRMHGSTAGWDRDRCKTCHAPSACVSCHRTTTPTSHRGGWRQRHGQIAGDFVSNCQICHSQSWCRDCHRSGR